MLEGVTHHWLQPCGFEITIGLTNYNHNFICHINDFEENLW